RLTAARCDGDARRCVNASADTMLNSPAGTGIAAGRGAGGGSWGGPARRGGASYNGGAGGGAPRGGGAPGPGAAVARGGEEQPARRNHSRADRPIELAAAPALPSPASVDAASGRSGSERMADDVAGRAVARVERLRAEQDAAQCAVDADVERRGRADGPAVR